MIKIAVYNGKYSLLIPYLGRNSHMRMWSKLILFLALVAGALCSKPLPTKNLPVARPQVDENDAAKFLLPGDAIPSAYKLDLITHIENFKADDSNSFKYQGVNTISINVPKDTATITLHSHDTIVISKATLMDDTTEIELDWSDYNKETYKLTLKKKDTANANIPAKDYKLMIEFEGWHSDDMHGFYRSSYREGEEDRWLVTTQFEAQDARRAFPCFDEPQYKAMYTISVTISTDLVTKGYNVLSNMPTSVVTPDPTSKTTKFEFLQSLQALSSYLVAFIVSDFKPSPEATFDDGAKKYITWGRERYITNKLADVSQIAGPAALEVMSKKLNIPFTYPKMDQVGIPDFSAGAMENWGLCTYRERMLFFDKSKQSTAAMQQVVTVTVHEFGHQWFGDLVTLHWWSDIWLNEGFATFFEYHATAEIATKDLDTSTWQIPEQFVTDELQQGALTVDAESSSRPLTSVVYSFGDVEANFDDVAYSKGGSVLRMWMHALEPVNFYKGLTDYLNKNQVNVGTPELLLEAFEDALPDGHLLKGKVLEHFATWHKEAGYPVLIATRNNDSYTVTQERFLASGKKVDTKWTVPITYTTSKKATFDDTKPTLLFTKDEPSIDIAHEDAAWILLNLQETGLYRVHYDNDTWLAITETLHTEPTTIHTVNRAQLIDDALWLARSTNDYLTYDIALNLTNYLANEKELIPWKSALNGFNFLYGRLATTDSGDYLTSFVRKLLEARFSDLSLTTGEKDSHTQKLLRGLIASWSCKLGVDDCVSQAVGKFEGERSEIDPDLRSVVLCTGVRESGVDKWTEIWDEYTTAIDSSEQTLLLSVLGCTKDSESINTFLGKTLDDAEIRKQDKSAAFSAVLNGNPENLNVALEFLSNNLEKISASYGGLDPLGKILLEIATKLGSNDDEVNKMKEIVDKINKSQDPGLVGAQTSANNALAIVQSNNDWVKSKEEAISEWLQANSATSISFAIVGLLLPVINFMLY